MPGFVPGIHVFRCCRTTDVDGRDEPGHDVERACSRYSITACSGAACLRSAALLEPIMIASGIVHRMKIITS